MGLTVSAQASNAYAAYALKNSETYENYAVDTSEVSENYFNISSVSDAVDAMNSVLDSTSSLYSVGRVDSFVRSQYQFSQLGIYENLRERVSSYDVSGVLSSDTDLSDMYKLANTSNQVSSDYISSLLESSGYTESNSSSYSSYLEEESGTSGLLDVTV